MPISTYLALGMVLGVVGCSRQDTECLGRIGRKLLDRAQAASEEIGGKLDLGWKKKEPAVEERVEQDAVKVSEQ